MQLTSLDAIVIPPNRQRKIFTVERIAELADSIAQFGLMHPIVLRNDGRTLVAGECRLRAITGLHSTNRAFKCDGQLIPHNNIPFVHLGDLSPADLYEAELEENVRRLDITWQEKATAIAELHRLRQAANPKHTQTDTAEELFGAVLTPNAGQQTVSNALILARAMELDKDVRRAPSAAEAHKIIQRKRTAEQRVQLNVRANEHTLIHGDANTELPKFPSYNFDLILTDPDYGINANKFGPAAQLSHGYGQDAKAALASYRTLAQEGFRVCKPNAYVFAFCDIEFFLTLRDMFGDAGWSVFRTPLMWAKGTSSNSPGHFPWPHTGPRRLYELILYAIKGDKHLLQPLFPDVLLYPPDADSAHPAAKPVDLYRKLIQVCAPAGSKILDPFCGGGTIFRAATAESVIATGIELDNEYHRLAQSQLTAREP